MRSIVHKMGLYEECFNEIKKGQKTVEVRLNDEKRRAIKVGDTNSVFVIYTVTQTTLSDSVDYLLRN